MTEPASQPFPWKLLLVDDDEDDYLVTRAMLSGVQGKKYSLDWASTYESARQALQTCNYDAVLVDYDLGAHNGLDLIREANGNAYSSAFILYTGRGSSEVDLEAMQAGASLYLTKGETSALMLERGIRYAIERKKGQISLLEKEEALFKANNELKAELARREQAEVNMQVLFSRQQLLSEAAAELLAGADPIDRLETFFAMVSDNLGLEVFVQYNLSADGRHLKLGKMRGFAPRHEKLLQRLELGQAVCGTVALTRKPIYVNDVQQSDDPKVRLIRSMGIGTYACHPLMVEGRLIGTLSFGSRKLSRFDADTIYLLKTFCDLVAHALDRKRYEYALQESVVLRSALSEIQNVLYSEQGYDDWMQKTISVACQALGCDTAAISLLREHSWVVTSVCGFPQEVIGSQMDNDTESHAILAIQTRKPVVVNDAFNDERVNQEHMRRWNIRSVLVVPILVHNQAVGVVFFNHQSHRLDFNDEQIQFATTLASTLSMALENARLIQQLQNEVVEREKAESDLADAFEDLEVINEELRVSNEELFLQQETLRQSEQRWATTLSSIGDAVMAVDLEGNVSYLNPVAEQLTGFSLDEAGGLPLRRVLKIISQQTGKALDDPVLRVLETGKIVGLANDTALVARDGRVIPIEDSAAPICDAGGQVQGVVLVFHDITEKRKAEAELISILEILRESEDRARHTALELEILFNAISEAVIVFNSQGVPVRNNPAAIRVFGQDPSGKSFQELAERWKFTRLDGTPVNFAELPFSSALRGEQTRPERYCFTNGEGQETVVLASASPLYSPDNRFLGAVSIFSDISNLEIAARRQQESEKKIREILESINDGFFSLDQDWRVTYVNEQAAWQGLRQAGELSGKVIWEADPILVGSTLETVFRRVMQARQAEQIEFHSQRSGKWFQLRVYPFSNGISVYSVDITEQKHAEEALQAYAMQLKQSNQELENFAFIASHDLKAPLRRIEQYGSLVMKAAGPQLGETERDYLKRMLQAAERMQLLVEDLLALSRITTEGQPFTEVDLDQIVHSVLDDLQIQIEKTGGRVEAGHLPRIQADPIQMRQLIQNLIDNALKFHNSGVAPVVKVHSHLFTGNRVEICVEDDGIGFDREQASKLFQPFQRLHGRIEYEGTGIGLAICKKIVERHGGSITAQSEPGKGSVFTVTLPASNR